MDDSKITLYQNDEKREAWRRKETTHDVNRVSNMVEVGSWYGHLLLPAEDPRWSSLKM